ncbi:MAG: hypothetical protein NTZ63_06465, partial [Candidatus Omnitrophica bacterium]|nr:hypothetical protein [Candidatus Omnitrophota bacterium]
TSFDKENTDTYLVEVLCIPPSSPDFTQLMQKGKVRIQSEIKAQGVSPQVYARAYRLRAMRAIELGKKRTLKIGNENVKFLIRNAVLYPQLLEFRPAVIFKRAEVLLNGGVSRKTIRRHYAILAEDPDIVLQRIVRTGYSVSCSSKLKNTAIAVAILGLLPIFGLKAFFALPLLGVCVTKNNSDPFIRSLFERIVLALIPLGVTLTLSFYFGCHYLAACSTFWGALIAKSIVGGIARGSGSYMNQMIRGEKINLAMIVKWALAGLFIFGPLIFGAWYGFLIYFVPSNLWKVILDVTVCTFVITLPLSFLYQKYIIRNDTTKINYKTFVKNFLSFYAYNTLYWGIGLYIGWSYWPDQIVLIAGNMSVFWSGVIQYFLDLWLKRNKEAQSITQPLPEPRILAQQIQPAINRGIYSNIEYYHVFILDIIPSPEYLTRLIDAIPVNTMPLVWTVDEIRAFSVYMPSLIHKLQEGFGYEKIRELTGIDGIPDEEKVLRAIFQLQVEIAARIATMDSFIIQNRGDAKTFLNKIHVYNRLTALMLAVGLLEPGEALFLAEELVNGKEVELLIEIKKRLIHYMEILPLACVLTKKIKYTAALTEEEKVRFGYINWLKAELGDNLQAIVLYGSAAREKVNFNDYDNWVVVHDLDKAYEKLRGTALTYQGGVVTVRGKKEDGKEATLNLVPANIFSKVFRFNALCDRTIDTCKVIYGEIEVYEITVDELLERSVGSVYQRLKTLRTTAIMMARNPAEIVKKDKLFEFFMKNAQFIMSVGINDREGLRMFSKAELKQRLQAMGIQIYEYRDDLAYVRKAMIQTVVDAAFIHREFFTGRLPRLHSFLDFNAINPRVRTNMLRAARRTVVELCALPGSEMPEFTPPENSSKRKEGYLGNITPRQIKERKHLIRKGLLTLEPIPGFPDFAMGQEYLNIKFYKLVYSAQAPPEDILEPYIFFIYKRDKNILEIIISEEAHRVLQELPRDKLLDSLEVISFHEGIEKKSRSHKKADKETRARFPVVTEELAGFFNNQESNNWNNCSPAAFMRRKNAISSLEEILGTYSEFNSVIKENVMLKVKLAELGRHGTTVMVGRLSGSLGLNKGGRICLSADLFSKTNPASSNLIYMILCHEEKRHGSINEEAEAIRREVGAWNSFTDKEKEEILNWVIGYVTEKHTSSFRFVLLDFMRLAKKLENDPKDEETLLNFSIRQYGELHLRKEFRIPHYLTHWIVALMIFVGTWAALTVSTYWHFIIPLALAFAVLYYYLAKVTEKRLLNKYLDADFRSNILSSVTDGEKNEAEKITKLLRKISWVYKLSLVRNMVNERKKLLAESILINIIAPNVSIQAPRQSILRSALCRRIVLEDILASKDRTI